MRCFELLGERFMTRDFDRPVTELQISAVILNRFIPLGTPLSQRAGWARPGNGTVRPSVDLCDQADQGTLQFYHKTRRHMKNETWKGIV
jgi:hypothetical protein